ncbi:MAG TPA: DUF805 domain-containing protein [Candidatus Paceibacterota bacterium]|jgi:uncharacterized membrane protein YhaH (DUF805 family)
MTAMDLQEGWDQLQKWMRKDRLGRRRYVEINVLSGVIGFAVILLPLLVVLLLPDFESSNYLMIPAAAVGIATAIIMLLIYIATSIARLRDMGNSTHWFVAGLIPYINVVFFIILAFREGKASRLRTKKGVPAKAEPMETVAPAET